MKRVRPDLDGKSKELGSHRGTFFRIHQGERHIVSFQVMQDALAFIGDRQDLDLYQVDHFENGVIDTLVSAAHIN